jgi:hypothetical protein
MRFADLGYTIADRRWALMGVGAGFGAAAGLVVAALLRPMPGPTRAKPAAHFGGAADFTIFHALTVPLMAGSWCR